MSGQRLLDGVEGELVLTSLTKEALPIIRYRTRDLTRLLPPTSRSMRSMAKIVGRSDDMLIIRGVNVFPSQIEELVLKIKGLAPYYQLEVFRERSLDVLYVHVEAALSGLGTPDYQQCARELEQSVKVHVGVSTSVRVHDSGTLERSAGKAKRVIDRRTN